jgi:uncharacterized membrane protein
VRVVKKVRTVVIKCLTFKFLSPINSYFSIFNIIILLVETSSLHSRWGPTRSRQEQRKREEAGAKEREARLAVQREELKLQQQQLDL